MGVGGGTHNRKYTHKINVKKLGRIKSAPLSPFLKLIETSLSPSKPLAFFRSQITFFLILFESEQGLNLYKELCSTSYRIYVFST